MTEQCDWIEEEPSTDEWTAVGGSLSVAGRRAAIEHALPLLGTYFSRGTEATLVEQRGPARVDSSLDDHSRLLAALRLRTGLAATSKLLAILRWIQRRPNFRYQSMRSESVGAVRGRIDVVRYGRSLSGITSPPRYPIVKVVRGRATPENVLAVAAGTWLISELTAPEVVSVLPSRGIERTVAGACVADLRRHLSLPAFAACREDARNVLRKNRLQALARQVRRRLGAGHVGNSKPYAELLEWVCACLEGRPAATAGDLDWSFYGAEFDSKLFEIWCLSQLAEQISSVLLETPPPPDLIHRGKGPLYVWRTTAGDVGIHFQRSIPVVDSNLRARWFRVGERQVALGGTPDIVVVIEPRVGPSRIVVLDPKLRQRSHAPVEEMYKMVGYFGNYGQDDSGRGAVLYYATSVQNQQVYEYGTERDGRLLAMALDPASPDGNVHGLTALRSLVLSELGLKDTSWFADAELVASADPDTLIDRQQRLEVNFLRAVARRVGDEALRPWANQLELFFPDTWTAIGPEVREMLVTAIYVGNILQEDRDYSGPVLGLAAAAESLLWDLMLTDAAMASPEVNRAKMLGQALALVSEALDGKSGAARKAVRDEIYRRGAAESLRRCMGALHRMNRDFRRPAAHRTLVTRPKWLEFHRFMLVGSDPLLPALVKAVSLPEEPDAPQ